MRDRTEVILRCNCESGFSLPELIIAMVISLVILGVGVMTFSGALGSRERQSSRADAIASAQAALNVMSREIGNSGYGLTTNGIVISDSNDKRLHLRANITNTDSNTNGRGEDITFFYDTASQSVVRYDAASATSGIVNRVSDVDFVYFNYADDGTFTQSTTPTAQTARVTITLTVILANIVGQPQNQTIRVTSDVTLRNAPYMLKQY